MEQIGHLLFAWNDGVTFLLEKIMDTCSPETVQEENFLMKQT